MGQPRTSAKEFIIGGASSLLPCCCRRKSAWLKYYFAEFEGNLETSTSSPHGFFFELARQEGRPTWWISQSRILTPAFRLLFLVFFTYPSIPRWPNRTEGGVVVVRMKRREEGKITFFCSSSSSDLLACMISRQASFPPSPSPLFRQNSYHHSRHFCYNLSRMY